MIACLHWRDVLSILGSPVLAQQSSKEADFCQKYYQSGWACRIKPPKFQLRLIPSHLLFIRGHKVWIEASNIRSQINRAHSHHGERIKQCDAAESSQQQLSCIKCWRSNWKLLLSTQVFWPLSASPDCLTRRALKQGEFSLESLNSKASSLQTQVLSSCRLAKTVLHASVTVWCLHMSTHVAPELHVHTRIR